MLDAVDPDWPIRAAAFDALRRLVALHGPVLHWSQFSSGFSYSGETYLFANQSKGIFRPSGMKGAALSIKTTIARAGGLQRYADIATDAAFDYAFQDRGLDYHDNQILLRACESRIPVIYFFGVEPAFYRPLWPAYVAEVDRERARFRILIADGVERVLEPGTFVADGPAIEIQRRYATVMAKRRLHQDLFAHLVLQAYATRCAICNLPRRELLDAAHIVADRDERGAPSVPNGLALCKLHHSAFDANLIGIRPDSMIEIAPRLLEVRDGPTLEHAIKGFDGQRLHAPRRPADAPSKDNLELRYDEFRRSA